MTHDKHERKYIRSYGRFDHKGKGKRAASKSKRRRLAREIARLTVSTRTR